MFMKETHLTPEEAERLTREEPAKQPVVNRKQRRAEAKQSRSKNRD